MKPPTAPEAIRADAELVELLRKVEAARLVAVDVKAAHERMWTEIEAASREVDALLERVGRGEGGPEITAALGAAYRRRLRHDTMASTTRLGEARDAFHVAQGAVWKHMARYMPGIDF